MAKPIVYYKSINKYLDFESDFPNKYSCKGKDCFSILIHPTHSGGYTVEEPVIVSYKGEYTTHEETFKGEFFVSDRMVKDEPKFTVINPSSSELMKNQGHIISLDRLKEEDNNFNMQIFR